jgi:hypothetical protein
LVASNKDCKKTAINITLSGEDSSTPLSLALKINPESVTIEECNPSRVEYTEETELYTG